MPVCQSGTFIPAWLPVTFSEQNEEHPDHLWAPGGRKVEKGGSNRKTCTTYTYIDGEGEGRDYKL